MFKVFFYSCLFASTLLLPTIQNVQAEIFRWVDKNGKVHFTDKPPEQLKQKTKTINIKQSTSTGSVRFPRVATHKPIKNTTTVDTRSVLLEKLSFDFEGNAEAENAFGKTYKYNRHVKAKVEKLRQSDKAPPYPFPCQLEGNLTINNANYIIKNSEFNKPFKEVFEENGYTVAGQKTFARQQVSTNDLSLAAKITDIRFSHCGNRSAHNLRSFTQNSTYMKVEWTVFDNLARKVIFKTTTEGLDDSFKKSARFNGAAVSAGLAFQQAVEHLLSQQALIDLLHSSPMTKTSFLDESESLDDVKIEQGNLSSSFISKTGGIEKAAVTIRTAGGHGSGFLISSPGYILTNQHVVGESRQVIVIINGKKMLGEVVRSHSGRDVALVKLKTRINSQPLLINADKVNLGEEIYVVGTPLDEKLDFSITRGIISARRMLDDRSYYQTDAAVNPGNSGGPVFNKSGNVIGITVAGIFTSDGASKNINYVIPILDALDALKLKTHLN